MTSFLTSRSFSVLFLHALLPDTSGFERSKPNDDNNNNYNYKRDLM